MSERPWIVDLDPACTVRTFSSLERAMGCALSAIAHRDALRARISHRRTGVFMLLVAVRGWQVHCRMIGGLQKSLPSRPPRATEEV